jgi:hypothetical protein
VDLQLTDPNFVRFVGRRIFNLACRGRKFCHFTSHLALVAPPDPLYTVHTHRSLRVGDMVTLDGDRWMVHGCSPHYEKDWEQLADYELELFRSDLTYS